jgi:uncharacterized membrane protein YgcG
MIVDIEVKYKKEMKERAEFEKGTGRQNWFPAYIHILKQPDEHHNNEWFGYAGQIRKDLNRTYAMISADTKRQLTNPNNGLQKTLVANIDNSIENRMTQTTRELTLDLRELKEEMASMHNVLNSILRSNNIRGALNPKMADDHDDGSTSYGYTSRRANSYMSGTGTSGSKRGGGSAYTGGGGSAYTGGSVRLLIFFSFLP